MTKLQLKAGDYVRLKGTDQIQVIEEIDNDDRTLTIRGGNDEWLKQSDFELVSRG